MVQGSGRLRLLLKAVQPVRIARHKGWQDFDRDFAPQSRIAGAIYFAHSAGAQQADNFVSIQLRTRG